MTSAPWPIRYLLIRRHQRVVSQRLTGEQGAVLLHLDTSAYHKLNDVGAYVWDVIADPLRLEQVCERVSTRFADAPGSLATDVRDFLQSLMERGLIAFDPGQGSSA